MSDINIHGVPNKPLGYSLTGKRIMVHDPTAPLNASTVLVLASEIAAGGALNEVFEYSTLAAFPGTGTADTIYIAADTNFIYRWNGSGYTQVGGGSPEVFEYANLGAFPGTGATDTIYIAADTNLTYRWNGATYVQIGGSTPPSATETVQGIAEIATQAETTTGTDDQRIITPLKLAQRLAQLVDIIYGLVSGGTVTWSGSGLTFNITPAVYYIDSVKYTQAGSTSVTLTAADPTLDRIDVIAVDSSGNTVVITGVAAANPETPQVDPNTQVALTSVFVQAGATTPTGVTSTLVWDENTGGPGEFVGSAVGIATNFNNTTAPYHSAKHISTTGWAAGNQLNFLSGSTISFSDSSTITFFIRLLGAVAGSANITVQLLNNNTAISNVITLNSSHGFVKGTVGSYQSIAIPINTMGLISGSGNKIRIAFTGSNASGFYLDYIQLQGGISTGTSNAVTNISRTGDNIFQTINGVQSLAFSISDKVTGNVAITGATKTKITYDTKGLVTSGADATTADINDSTNRRYVTDAQLTVIGNTSGVNSGDEVFEYANIGAFPGTGTVGVLYMSAATNFLYRWDGVGYSQVGGSGTPPVVATAAELNTGTDNAKYASALALEGSKYDNQNKTKIHAVASGTDTYTASMTPALTAYVTGQQFNILFTNANTGASTININGLGAKAIQRDATTALSSGDISAGRIMTLLYDGTAFQVAGGGSVADASSTVKGILKLTNELGGTAALPTLDNAAVIGKVLTGFSQGPGNQTVVATDTILQAFQKLAGNDARTQVILVAVSSGNNLFNYYNFR